MNCIQRSLIMMIRKEHSRLRVQKETNEGSVKKVKRRLQAFKLWRLQQASRKVQNKKQKLTFVKYFIMHFRRAYFFIILDVLRQLSQLTIICQLTSLAISKFSILYLGINRWNSFCAVVYLGIRPSQPRTYLSKHVINHSGIFGTDFRMPELTIVREDEVQRF